MTTHNDDGILIKAKKAPTIELAFDLANPSAQALIESSMLAMVTTIEEGLKVEATKAITEGMKLGEGIPKIRNRLMDAVKGYSKVNARRVARTESAKAANQATLESYKQSGVVRGKRWLASPGACEECSALDGVEVGINESFPGGYDAPPDVHPNSYSEDTDILTVEGFRNIKEIKKGDKIIALNPSSYDLDETEVINEIAHYQAKMIQFLSRDFDLLVTPNHDMFIEHNIDHGASGNKWEKQFCLAQKLPRKYRIYRSSQWKGQKQNKIMGIETELFCAFMGFWLAEGSLGHTNQVDISQSRLRNPTNYFMILNILLRMEGNVYQSEKGLVLNNPKIYDYLKQFGHSPDKYVPADIKQLPSKDIRIFLDCFNLGDGNRKNNSHFKGGNFRPYISYFTSSNKLASDLGELILKVGRRPSYHLDEVKGKEVQFANGNYIINNNLWRIYECYNEYGSESHIKQEIVAYNKMAYCVELNKDHILYVRRNGKCCWSGNCACTTTAVL